MIIYFFYLINLLSFEIDNVFKMCTFLIIYTSPYQNVSLKTTNQIQLD